MQVALLAEGVDRNAPYVLFAQRFPVALLAEGVDRNFYLRPKGQGGGGRPPRGGRG